MKMPSETHNIITNIIPKLQNLRWENSGIRRVKSESELSVLFSKLNEFGRAARLTLGIERLPEISKILFIKMLVDNRQYLDNVVWK